MTFVQLTVFRLSFAQILKFQKSNNLLHLGTVSRTADKQPLCPAQLFKRQRQAISVGSGGTTFQEERRGARGVSAREGQAMSRGWGQLFKEENVTYFYF